MDKLTSTWKVTVVVLVVVFAIAGFVGGFYYGNSQHPTSTVTAEKSGKIGILDLSAKIIAHSNEVISGDVNASGYSIGVYIGPGVRNVTVSHAQIYDAQNEGILAVDTTSVYVVSDHIYHNGMDPNASIHISGSVGFYGVSNSNIINNNITDNNISGIVVSSSSKLVPAGVPVPLVNMSAHNVLVANNIVANDAGGCGIVVVAWGPFMETYDVTVQNNTVLGSVFGSNGRPTGPYVGTIVIAADFPFSQANNNSVIDNRVVGGLEDGIIINNQAAGAKDLYNRIIGNYVTEATFQRLNNPPFDNATDLNLANETNGIAVYSNYIPQTAHPMAPQVNYTIIAQNTIVNEQIGIWIANAYNNAISGNSFINVAQEVTTYYGESTAN